MRSTSPLLDNENTVTHKPDSSFKLLERMLKIPFSQSSFLHYTKSMSQTEKIELVKVMKLDLFKKWSDILFIKKLSLALKKINTDNAMMKQILQLISKLIIQPEPTLEQYSNHLVSYVKEQQYWPVYWSIYYHSERLQNEAIITSLLEKLSNNFLSINENKALTIPVLSTEADNEVVHEQQKYEKRIALLEAKANKEAQLRIQMEQELTKQEKINRIQKLDIEKQTQALEHIKQKFNESLHQLEKQEQYAEMIQRKKREEEEKLLHERSALLQQIKQLSDEIKKQGQLVEQLNQQLEETKKQNISLTQAQNQLHKQKAANKLEQEPTEKLIAALQYKLHRRIERVNSSLLKPSEEQSYSMQIEQKQKKLNFLKDTIALIEHTEQYLQLDALQVQAKPPLASSNNVVETVPPIQEESGLSGTFYRRDHGGYVELETGESFNITESLVQQLELQHEAEVLCIPSQHAGKTHYTIKIEFQGDDAYSPITQYDGYVFNDEDGKWYCIDINDETRKFPIHFKDIDIQKPSPGDPCTFNVANDGYIARLTRLYRQLPGESNDTSFTAKKIEKAKTATAPVAKEKLEPYLAGCTITIIGGQRKWFENVVKETGAELVHNGGERPERIASDLARSQALFMILTSTSHRATWEGVEIAKANQIPHFTIQGSKSNLRSLLWDNQQLIKQTNRQ